jgi:hypothetical protein
MSDWKNAYRSFYYETAATPGDIRLDAGKTALLVIDIQNTYMEVDADPVEAGRWAPFRERMNDMPGTRRRGYFRAYRLFEAGRARPLAEPEETRVQLPAAAERPRRQPAGARVDARAGRYRRDQNNR